MGDVMPSFCFPRMQRHQLSCWVGQHQLLSHALGGSFNGVTIDQAWLYSFNTKNTATGKMSSFARSCLSGCWLAACCSGSTDQLFCADHGRRSASA